MVCCFTPSSRSLCFANTKQTLTIAALLRRFATLQPTQKPKRRK
nr:MAG TPA: hypothetical protein [Caudoviricetes sp.]